MISAKLLGRSILVLFILFTFVSTSPVEEREPNCFEVVIPVDISAENALLPSAYTINDFVSTLTYLSDGFLGRLLGILGFSSLFSWGTIQNTYNIAGRYCEPEVYNASRANTLQLLAHPATYDRNYWSGGGYPGYGYAGDNYSWIATASKQGYPSFAFDRLGNGNSTLANGIVEVQCPAQAATVHEMVRIIRLGPSGGSPLPRAFNKIILVGSSLGSIVANIVNAKYPDDVDATILTGFTKEWINVVPGFVATALLLPAPGRPLGYLQATNEAGVAFLLFYSPYYDPEFIRQDYVNRGTITVGEGVTGAIGIVTAPQYTKPVFVINGEQDSVFCGTTGLEINGPGNCNNGILAATEVLYPASSSYSYYILPNSGHCWEHGYYAQQGFNVSHAWIAQQGF